MGSEHCGPCPETECIEVSDGESDALKTLYKRMMDNQQKCEAETPGAVTKDCGPNAGLRPPPATMPPTPYEKSPACDEITSLSVLKRFDTYMTTVLDSRSGGAMDGGKAAHNKATVPDPVLFAKCEATPPGSINTMLYGLDVEQAVVGAPAARDELMEAALSLLKAEAACKHGGAVKAAEIAALKQPEAKYAEDAARIGANAYTSAAKGDKPGGMEAETPVEVVAYVGCTKPRPTTAADDKCVGKTAAASTAV